MAPGRTKFGVLASNFAQIASMSSILCGGASIYMGMFKAETVYETGDFEDDGLTESWVGLFAVIVGITVIAWERFCGVFRMADSVPWRAFIYLVIAVPMVFSWLTIFCTVLFGMSAIANLISGFLGESEAPKLRKRGGGGRQKGHEKLASNDGVDVPKRSCGQIVRDWVQRLKEENKIGKYVFLSSFFAINVILFITTIFEWQDMNNDLLPRNRLSDFGPFAKGFGKLLDFNCSIMLLPVCRTFIRIIYNRSTADQRLSTRILRTIFTFIPLDKNIKFHKLCAVMVFMSAVGHVFFHFLNYTVEPDNTIAIFGLEPWFTGFGILFCMFLIYAASSEQIRWGHFEMFWYTHHTFIFFFALQLFHGNGGWNPNFWKWFIGPGLLYLGERVLRKYKGRQPATLNSFEWLPPSVLCIRFAKTGVFKGKGSYKEGQYMFLNCPHISQHQWHPFTISSAPQEDTVSVHIRIMGEGSWTRSVREYLALLAPKGATEFQFRSNATKAGQEEGIVNGPDGQPIFRLDGPHSAPTQHIGEYSNVMIAAAGIGVTPLASTMKSIVMHRWKFSVGRCFPANAHFYWVCSARDLDSFRWFCDIIKEACDDYADMCVKNPASMADKRFSMDIWVTSCKGKAPTKDQVAINIGDIAFTEKTVKDSDGQVKVVAGEEDKKWSVEQDPDSGDPFYFNNITQESTWDKPDDLEALKDAAKEKARLDALRKKPSNNRGRQKSQFQKPMFTAGAPKTKQSRSGTAGIEIRKLGQTSKAVDVPPADQLFKLLQDPPDECALGTNGALRIHRGRPKWGPRFQEIAGHYPENQSVGVMYCGNRFIAKDLKKQCNAFSDGKKKRFFRLHKENF